MALFLFVWLSPIFSCGPAEGGPNVAFGRAQMPAQGQDTVPDVLVPASVVPPPAGMAEERHLEFSMEYIMGRFDPAVHPDFVPVDPMYADGEGYYLRRDAYDSFRRMWAAAQSDGIRLTIISATRNFQRQKQIWEAKWTGMRKIENGANAAEKYPDPRVRALKILEYSSMPGTSRHHWGTDLDLNDLDNYTFEHGQGRKVYEWLQAHAAEYGYCQPYTARGIARPEGYNEEKWHWSYAPVSRELTRLAGSRLRDEMIDGFEGAETAKDIGVVRKYVLGVNEDCR
jgi:D-alanyl-D-alanine carboxypeptidase